MFSTIGLRPDEYIDISAERETNPTKLQEVICNAVKDTQPGFMMVPLPHMLIMTARQYVILDPYDDMVGAYKAKERVYITRDRGDILNAMDVVVKDPENLPPIDGDGI